MIILRLPHKVEPLKTRTILGFHEFFFSPFMLCAVYILICVQNPNIFFHADTHKFS